MNEQRREDWNFWNKTGRRTRGGLEKWLESDESGEVHRSTYNAQTNVDVRLMALIDRFILTLGYEPKGASDLLRSVLELVGNTAKKEIAPPMLVEEALEYLQERGYSLEQFRYSKIQKRKLSQALRRDELVLDGRVDRLTESPWSRGSKREEPRYGGFTMAEIEQVIADQDMKQTEYPRLRGENRQDLDCSSPLEPVSGDSIEAQKRRAEEDSLKQKEQLAAFLAQARGASGEENSSPAPSPNEENA